MPGLINMTLDEDPLKNVKGFDPSLRTLDQKTETVQGQLDTILGKDGPLMQSARTRAAQNANARGLLNSSMAVQAGEQAVIDSALPIAAADAAAYNRAGETNQASQNLALQFGADASNRIAGQQLAGRQSLEQIGAQGAQQRQTIGTQTDAESRLIGERAGAETRLIGARTAAESQLMEQKRQIDLALQTADAANRERLLQQQGVVERQLQEMRGAQAIEQQQLRGSQELQLQGLRGEQAQMLAQIEGTHRELLQTSASASSMYSGIVRNISEAMNNADMDPATKQIAIDRNIDLLDAGLAILSGISGLDLNSLLNFGGTA